MSSPTQRSLKLLRSEGFTAEVVERYNSFCKRRIDLFNFIDIVAIKGNLTLGVQTTTRDNMQARVEKIKAEPMAKKWYAPRKEPFGSSDGTYGHTIYQEEGRLIEVHGWAKVGGRGKRKVWECKRVQVIP